MIKYALVIALTISIVGCSSNDTAEQQWDARAAELTPEERLELCVFVQNTGSKPAARIMLDTPEDDRFTTPTDEINMDNFPIILEGYCNT